MRAIALVVLVAACGRWSFDDIVDAGDGNGSNLGDGRGDAPVSTGPKGARWVTRYNDTFTRLAGSNGQLAMVASFNSPFSVDGVPTISGAGFTNSAVIRWDTDGTVMSSSLLENDGFCDMRGITMDGPDVVLGGFAEASNALPQYQVCGVLASRQQPLVLRVNSAGTQTLIAQWAAAGVNGQTWRVARMPDGSFMSAGIYGQDLTAGSIVLPTAAADPDAWIAHTKAGTTSMATWAHGIIPAAGAEPGPFAVDGDETCMLGSHYGAANVLGTAVPFVGGNGDAFVTRIDSTGNAKFVRAIGSVGDDSASNNGSVVALPDGGCVAGILATGDVTLDSVVYPANIGLGLAVRFSATGSVVWARRFQNAIFVASVGNRLIGAYRVDSTATIGSTMYSPMGTDTVIVELGASAAQDVLLGVVGGGGNQDAYDLTTVGPDAVAFKVFSIGQMTFGSTTLDTASGKQVTGVLGI